MGKVCPLAMVCMVFLCGCFVKIWDGIFRVRFEFGVYHWGTYRMVRSPDAKVLLLYSKNYKELEEKVRDPAQRSWRTAVTTAPPLTIRPPAP